MKNAIINPRKSFCSNVSKFQEYCCFANGRPLKTGPLKVLISKGHCWLLIRFHYISHLALSLDFFSYVCYSIVSIVGVNIPSSHTLS